MTDIWNTALSERFVVSVFGPEGYQPRIVSNYTVLSESTRRKVAALAVPWGTGWAFYPDAECFKGLSIDEYLNAVSYTVVSRESDCSGKPGVLYTQVVILPSDQYVYVLREGNIRRLFDSPRPRECKSGEAIQFSLSQLLYRYELGAKVSSPIILAYPYHPQLPDAWQDVEFLMLRVIGSLRDEEIRLTSFCTFSLSTREHVKFLALPKQHLMRQAPKVYFDLERASLVRKPVYQPFVQTISELVVRLRIALRMISVTLKQSYSSRAYGDEQRK